MSDNKPQSPLKPNIFGHAPTTKTLRYKVEDANGNKHLIIETISIDMSGKNAGLTKNISARLSNGQAVQDLTQLQSLERNGDEINLLELVQNSTEREQLYHTEMNNIRIKALENGTSEEFDEALKKSGAYDSIAGGDSINDIKIESETTRNNEREQIEDKQTKDELEKFKKSIEVGGDYTYPVDMKWNEGQDYVFFEQFEYLPPQSTARSSDEDTLNNELGTVLSQGVGRGRNTGGTKRRHGSCKLPIPNKLGVSNGVNWGEGRANAVELSAFQSADRGIQDLVSDGNVLKALKGAKDQAGNALNVVKGDLSGRSERTGENINAGDILSATLARSALGAIGINVDVDQFITRQTGAAINPNLELLFGGPQLRSFSFNFTFAPNDTNEAKEVRQIQRWFRQGMLPSRRRASQSSGSALFLASPNVFRICYKNQNRRIKGLNIIKICALTSCQIDFTPDGTYQSYDDEFGVSMPVRSTMGLTFTELTPVFKDDYAPNVESPSMLDLDMNVQGTNAIDENDIGI